MTGIRENITYTSCYYCLCKILSIKIVLHYKFDVEIENDYFTIIIFLDRKVVILIYRNTYLIAR